MKYFLSALGLVFIIEGLPYFAFPDKLKVWLARIMEVPDRELRAYGLGAVAVGLLLVYLAQRSGLF